jgi:acyl-CoA reductase-like NAD-dependent aldehyde dehydrogenase
MTLDVRAKAIQAMRDVTVANAPELSKMAHEETKLGRIEDKIQKNRLAALKTPGLEILTPKAVTGDFGLTLTERAPFGVICSITPCTNATETIVNNGIGMIAGGNSVVINPHPSAKKTTVHFVKMLNQAIMAAGGPDNLICVIPEPTIESADKLMRHSGVRLVVVTGGGAVVKAAMSTGKKCIAAGPGNPPAVVDETAILPNAARDIIKGAGMDNNIICIVEKEIIAVEAIADRLKQELVRAGAYYIRDNMVQKLTELVIDGDHARKEFVGKNASFILKHLGIDIPDDVRIAFCEVDEEHPLVQVEQLMPIIPMFRARNVDEAIKAAVRVEHGYRHTAVMHSLNVENLHKYARAADCSIFVKNAPSLAGTGFMGEGHSSWTIASPTGEGMTTAINFTRERRCVLKDYFRIV